MTSGQGGRGRFYVLEGADGVGTTTQRGALAARLAAAGRGVHVTHEPSAGPIGRLIREHLASRAHDEHTRRELALLFAADRLDHHAREIEPRLRDGEDVVSDRYVLSSLVYQSLDLPLAWVEELNRFAPPADATILVTLPLELAMARLEARPGRDLFETRAIQERVHARYCELAPRLDALVVDGSGAVDEVTERIVQALRAASRL
jgi:dTMP kinase